MAKQNDSIVGRRLAIKDLGIARLAVRRIPWTLCGNIPVRVSDLSFVGRDDCGRMDWWAVTPPKTDYWHAHQVLGRAYAFELLDLINNPAAEEFPAHILAYITQDMLRWARKVSPCAGETMPHGFFEVLSEYMVTGEVNR